MKAITWKCPKCAIKEDTSEYVERLFHRHGEQLFALNVIKPNDEESEGQNRKAE